MPWGTKDVSGTVLCRWRRIHISEEYVVPRKVSHVLKTMFYLRRQIYISNCDVPKRVCVTKTMLRLEKQVYVSEDYVMRWEANFMSLKTMLGFYDYFPLYFD